MEPGLDFMKHRIEEVANRRGQQAQEVEGDAVNANGTVGCDGEYKVVKVAGRGNNRRTTLGGEERIYGWRVGGVKW